MHKHINKRLHRHDIVGTQQLRFLLDTVRSAMMDDKGMDLVSYMSKTDERGKGAIQMSIKVDVVKRMNEVIPVEMGVDPEDLLAQTLADAVEAFRETTILANPCPATRYREGAIEARRRSRAGRVGRGWVHGSGCIGGCRRTDGPGIDREDAAVLDLPAHPAEDIVDVFTCGRVSLLPRAIEPGV